MPTSALRRTALTAVLAAALGATTLLGTAQARPRAPQPSRPSPGPRIERISTAADGTQADGASGEAVISDDGRQVAFSSKAHNLGCGRGGSRCLFVKDLRTGALTTVGHLDNLDHWAPMVISGDGSHVGYSEGSHTPWGYVYDRTSGTTERIAPADPPPDASQTELLAFDRHARHLAFRAGNRYGSNEGLYLYVRDTATGTDHLVSGPEDLSKTAAQLSGDGRRVAFATRATADRPGNVYVADVPTGARIQANQGLGTATLVRLSEDGRAVVFTAQGGTYLRDLRTGRLRRVADTPAVTAGPQAREVLLSTAQGLSLLDVRTGRTTPVAPAGSTAQPGAVGARGRSVAFTSAADGLVPGDTNAAADVFVRRVP
ncbi:hypothetical protein [Streptomyces thermodiastaticus]|uniref:hypothetical protein n=1 Tax=Streptomyces thermodiastaticus TaxID=44061 RepID=UPI0016799A05|nr:hypothetical protein [Streptomyces thermodiastaticus]MCE7552555.1 hypothetical protein [Streptomyces thermodiastaticus]GHF87472.1 hypothetical protein GCM10018787_40240 [Streptomyces thermodiastaticus]